MMTFYQKIFDHHLAVVFDIFKVNIGVSVIQVAVFSKLDNILN